MSLVASMLNGSFSSANAVVTAGITSTGNVSTAGNVILSAVGKGVTIKEGTNARMGVATLDGIGGTVTVSTTAVTASSRIFLTPQAGTLNIGIVGVSARNAGQDFTILSSAVLDARVVAWMIVEPS